MTFNPNFENLYHKLLSLDEKSYRFIVVNFFRSHRHLTYITHGPLEHGADLLMLIEHNDDFIGRGQLVFIQVKRGHLKLGDWHSKLNGQLTELYCRSSGRPNISNDLPRRIILMTSGLPEQGVLDAIINWNTKLPVPVELIDGRQFAYMLHSEGIDLSNLDDLMHDPDLM